MIWYMYFYHNKVSWHILHLTQLPFCCFVAKLYLQTKEKSHVKESLHIAILQADGETVAGGKGKWGFPPS